MIIIEFPTPDAAREWYASPAYQAILPLRTQNSNGVTALVEGVPTGYRAVDKIGQLL